MSMKFSAVLALAATAAIAAEVSDYQVAQFEGMLVDVNAHLQDYMSLAMNNADFTIPSGVLDVYEHMTTYASGDDSYTSLFTEINFAQVTTVIEKLPWYSSRMLPIIESYLSAHSFTDTGAAAATGASSAASSSAASSSSSAAASSSSSSAAASSSSSAAASSSSAASSSKASSSSASSSSKASSTSSKASSTSSKASSTSSKASSSSSSSSASSTSSKSKNGAAQLSTGMGAFAAAVAMLL